MVDGMIVVGIGKTYPDLAVALVTLGVGFLCLFIPAFCIDLYDGCMDKRSAVVFVLAIALSCWAIWYGVTRPPIRTVKAIMEPGVDITEVVRKYEVQTIDGQIWELVEKHEAALPDGDPGQ